MNNLAERLRLCGEQAVSAMHYPAVRNPKHQVNGLRRLALAYFRHDVKCLGEGVGVGMALALCVFHYRETACGVVTLLHVPERPETRKERLSMKRYGVVLMVLTLLVLPLVARADETVIPPEMNWTPTPPARPTVDLVQLVQLLVSKGVISDQDYAQLTQPQLSSPVQAGHARVWRWDEIYRNPVQSRP
jgi:hypothetical protein